MITLDAKLEQRKDTEGPARRTYASLEGTRGFLDGSLCEGGWVLRICPMDVVSYWRHVGAGKPTAKDALYEEVKP